MIVESQCQGIFFLQKMPPNSKTPQKGTSPGAVSLGEGGSWAEGLSKGVFVHKKAQKRKRQNEDKQKNERKRKSDAGKSVPGKIEQNEDYLELFFKSRSDICVG